MKGGCEVKCDYSATGGSDPKSITSLDLCPARHNTLFAEAEINLLVHWVSHPILHTEFKDIVKIRIRDSRKSIVIGASGICEMVRKNGDK